VSEGGLEHGNRCDLPGSGKSCNKGNKSGAAHPGIPLSVRCLYRYLVDARLRAASGWQLPRVTYGRPRDCRSWRWQCPADAQQRGGGLPA
jgi:hypothetical protein